MKYDPRLRTWVEDDFDYEKNFKKQMDYINYKDLEKQLKENVDYYALLDENEAIIFLKELGCDIKSLLNGTVFPVTDVLSNFSGNIKDTPGVFKVAKNFKPINIGIFTHIINELKGNGIKAIEYLGKNGERYIKLTDCPGIRKYLNATRYLINNKKIMEVGIGSVAMEGSIVKGARFGVIYSAAYRSVELMFKSEYDLTNFFVNLSMDMAKMIVATIIAKTTVAAATSFVVTAALSTTAIAIGVFIIGALVVWGLMWLDDEFKISETIIKRLKEHKAKTPISTYHPDQIFNAWGRDYRG
ncbi:MULTISPECIES: hypothetical protein [Photorhabdus]|uniref:Inner membrane protein yafU n=2 Tax=Photorhabdus asymbiotica TaxID=291112 RepID=C7BIG5_PHOAA|nr:hypothetical protein [Photorhabdus asymbiotica]RKS66000.1 hypothetical protein BDD30_0277 [Photorhabdus asymbiotica]CAQ84103.1 conserved hypothetical protein [Photorhabdus asymbiotica]